MSTDFKSPFEVCSAFNEAHLNILSREILEVAEQTRISNTGEYDDRYTFETTLHGRLRQLFIKLNRDTDKPWLTLASSGMDYVPKINNIPLRVFRDEPRSPKKRVKIFNQNEIEKDQLILLLEDHDEVGFDTQDLYWRLMVVAPTDISIDEEIVDIEDDFKVALAGYHPTNNSLVSLWYSDDNFSNKIRPVSDQLIQEKPVERKQVTLKVKEQKRTKHLDE